MMLAKNGEQWSIWVVDMPGGGGGGGGEYTGGPPVSWRTVVISRSHLPHLGSVSL